MLKVNQISKFYSDNVGIRDISFTLEKGSVTALIGPNGSGKTTLLNVLAGILKYDSGEVLLDGLKTDELSVRQKIGYLPDMISINPRIKVIDLLYMVSDYKFNGKYKAEIESDLEAYHINNFKNTKFDDLSMGTKKKVGIIIAFMGYPNLIILDEPTNGMDTYGILQFKNSILKAKENKSTIILSSHILDFVNSVADNSIFLKNMKVETIVDNNENLENIYKKLYL